MIVHIDTLNFLFPRVLYNVGARHACDQGDGIDGYGYNKHDGRRYGLQTIKDGPSNIAITTEFVKVPGGDHGNKKREFY